MSIYPSSDKLDKLESKYALVILAAKRARQLKDGAPRLVECSSPNPLTIALEEIAAGKIIARIVEDATADAHQKALKPNEPSLEDIIAAGPVVALESLQEDSGASMNDGEEDEMLEGDEDDVRPMDAFDLSAPGLLVDLDDEEEDEEEEGDED